ncbi:type II secretion system F family protein [uncultured Modestobacter sp.]|uniref:type II secretion system F family protein n=1 Tax=uncultured Modestobacter sp. TaxID=380048 RepID=UPI00261C7100|nr:type II secretion system F family protein [uncultured Modestobacter sp.]
MTAVAVAALAGALLLWAPAADVRRDRLAAVAPRPQPAAARTRAPDRPPGTARRWSMAAAAGAGALLLLGGGLPAAVLAVGATVLAERLLRRAGASPDDEERLARDLPVACDLLAVCLTAGTPVGAAVAAVGGSVAGPLGERLVAVGGLYRLGAAPRRAWAGAPPPVDALARVVVRAGESGSAVAPALQRLAGDLRSSQHSRVEAAVRRAGVWVLAPLGLCFLPAFLCLGVVPLVLGIAADVF